jgi:2-polyprenyl-6-methoxyphenol hydroxylase-like FAD-dependent oxidoreductase
VLYPIEGDRWIVTLAGVGRDYPPTTDAGFLEFTRSLRDPMLYEILKTAQPLSPIYSYRRTENRFRHYEKISLPDGVVALGDAVCAFNPVYGQGMTTAALAAECLDRCLSQSESGEGLTTQFQKQLAQVIATPWLMATGEDARWSTTQGSQSNLMTRFVQAYIDRVQLVGLENHQIFYTFATVVHMLKEPATLFQPWIVVEVLKSLLKKRERDHQRRVLVSGNS